MLSFIVVWYTRHKTAAVDKAAVSAVRCSSVFWYTRKKTSKDKRLLGVVFCCYGCLICCVFLRLFDKAAA